MKHPGCWVILLLTLTAPLAAELPSTRTEVSEKLNTTRQDLKQVNQQKAQASRNLKRTAKAEKDILGELGSLGREKEAAIRDARVHVRNLAVVEDRLTSLKERQAQAGIQEQADRLALQQQLRAVQRSRVRQGAILLFSVRTPAEWAARATALRELSLNTRRRVLGLRKRIDQLQTYQTEYTHRETELRLLHGQAESARQNVLRKAALSRARLKEVRSKKDQARQVVAELALREDRLQNFMDGLQKEAQRMARIRPSGGNQKMHRTSSGPSTVRGRVPWPVQGRILSRFGKQRHPIFNVPVFNRNIEIAGAYGSAIKSIASGTVEYVGEMQDFGKLVVIDHGGGLKSVYGYASQASVQKDQAVAQGDVIGEVGEHGASGQPSLYFQISQNARPQDPLRYLARH